VRGRIKKEIKTDTTCHLCGCEYNESFDLYGCPNCLGEGLDEMPPKSNAERQADWRKRRAKLVEVRTHVKTEAQRKRLLEIAKEMRNGDRVGTKKQ